MARKPEEWYDSGARPVGPWDAVLESRRQLERLGHQYMVLNAYLQMPNIANKPKAIRWRDLCKMLLGLWARLTGDDASSFIGSNDEATDEQIKVAKDLELKWWATQVVSEVTEAGTLAVTAAMDARLRKISNQMAFYFSREIDELEQMFGL